MVYDNSFIKCKLTGSPCNQMCRFFDIDNKCKYQQLELRYIHIGTLVLLIKYASEKEIDDKDFFALIFTGKSIKTKMNTNQLSHANPSSVKLEKNNILNIDDIKEKADKLLEKLFLDDCNKKIEDINNLENKLGNIPDTLKEKRNILKSKNYNLIFRLSDFIDYICQYINIGMINNCTLTNDDLQTLILYLVYIYKPQLADFPYNKSINDMSIKKLILNTKLLDENNPLKWNDDREKKLMNESDEYKKYIWYDSMFYEWYMTTLTEKKLEYKNIPNSLILLKYLISEILYKISYLYTNKYIIFHYKEKDFFERTKNVINIFQEILNKLNFNLDYLINQEQKENTVMFKEEIKLKDVKFDKTQLNNAIFFNVLESKNYFEKISLFS